jgi:hypothetical protein
MKVATLLVLGVGMVSAQEATSTEAAAAVGTGLSVDSGLNLGSIDVGGVNLDSFDFNNQQDILNGIQLMLDSMCLGNLVNVGQFQNLGQIAALEMFLQLAQLESLFQGGFVNLFDVNGLFNSGILGGGFLGGANALFGGGNAFGFGGFKRSLEKSKRVCYPHNA